MPDNEIETEDDTEEQESVRPNSSADNCVWTSTGTESEDEGSNGEDDWHPPGETTEEEGATEDEEDISENQNYI